MRRPLLLYKTIDCRPYFCYHEFMKYAVQALVVENGPCETVVVDQRFEASTLVDAIMEACAGVYAAASLGGFQVDARFYVMNAANEVLWYSYADDQRVFNGPNGYLWRQCGLYMDLSEAIENKLLEISATAA